MQRKWTEAETQLLRDLYPTTRVKQIAAQLARTETSVKRRAFELGLRKNQRRTPAKAPSYPPGISHPRPGVTVHRMRG